MNSSVYIYTLFYQLNDDHLSSLLQQEAGVEGESRPETAPEPANEDEAEEAEGDDAE